MPPSNTQFEIPHPSRAVEVSVVVPTRNRPHFLRECLLALSKQTIDPEFVEVIVVDDGSYPRFLKPLLKIEQEFPGFIFVFRKNRGPAQARNAGASLASGRFIAFIDDDCVAAPTWLQEFVRQASNEVGLAGIEGKTQAQGPAPIYSHQTTNLRGGRYLTCNVMYDRDKFETAGGFDAEFPYPNREDTDLAIRMLKLGRIAFAPEAVVVHQIVRVSFGHFVRRLRYSGSDFYLYRKDKDGFRAMIAANPLRSVAGWRGFLSTVVWGVALFEFGLSRSYNWILLALVFSFVLSMLVLVRSERTLGIRRVYDPIQAVAFALENTLAELISVPYSIYQTFVWSTRPRARSGNPNPSIINGESISAGSTIGSPRISVVIPTRNRPDYLRRCLAAMANQTYPADLYEIVVVDDNSASGAYDEVIKAWAGNAKLTYLLRANRGGPSQSRQTGVENSSGELVVFTDDDCIAAPNWLDELIRPLREHPEAKGIEGVVIGPDECGLYDHFPLCHLGKTFLTANIGYWRQDLVAVGGLDPSFKTLPGSDTELALRILERGPILANPRAIVDHPAVRVPIGFHFKTLRRSVNYFYLRRRAPRAYASAVGRSPWTSTISRRAMVTCTLFWGAIGLALVGAAPGAIAMLLIPVSLLLAVRKLYRAQGVSVRFVPSETISFLVESTLLDLCKPPYAFVLAIQAQRRMRRLPQPRGTTG